MFGQGERRIKIERTESGEDLSLVVTKDNDAPHTYRFADIGALTRFQSDMEQFLVSTGWSLLEFSPERRTGRDRRTFPRLTERRRWWTDALNRPVRTRRRRD